MPEVPVSVSKRDGRVEPFDADKICQALFAATETLGTPNAFLARELTDAVVHFLAADAGSTQLATKDIAEQVGKVVRELGHPGLAGGLAQAAAQKERAPSPNAPEARSPDEVMHPDEVVERCLETYTLQTVFTRDLAAAHRDGLIVLGGLEWPRRLDIVLADMSGDLLQGLADARVAAGFLVVVDGPEWLGIKRGIADSSVAWLQSLRDLLGRWVVVNVNSAEPPAWAHGGGSPLFPEPSLAHSANHQLLRACIEAMRPAQDELLWRWHVQGRDFSAEPHAAILKEVAQRALDGANLTFAFDRPRRPVALGDGMDRRHAAVLTEVGVNLPVLLNHPSVGGDLRTFLSKLPSLARMAVSAAGQRRKYLRDQANLPSLSRGFLMDRAQCVTSVVGLDAVARTLSGQHIDEGPVALELALTVLRTLHTALVDAARLAHLGVAMDFTDVVRATPPAALKGRLITVGNLHAVGGSGTTNVVIPRQPAWSASDVVDLLAVAWKRTEIASLGVSF